MKKTWFQSFSIESAKYNRSIAEGLVDQLYERIHKDLKKNVSNVKKQKYLNLYKKTDPNKNGFIISRTHHFLQ